MSFITNLTTGHNLVVLAIIFIVAGAVVLWTLTDMVKWVSKVFRKRHGGTQPPKWIYPSVITNTLLKIKPQDDKDDFGREIGLNPAQVSVIIRPIVSLAAGLLLGFVLYLVALATSSTDILPLWAAIILSGLLALIFAQNDPAVEVPKAHVGIFTFLGYRYGVYFSEGTHTWYGGKLWCGISQSPLHKPWTEGESKGFVFTGRKQIEIWARKTVEDKSLVVSNVAGDFSDVMLKFTITIRTINPLKWATSDDPILDIAERARSTLRTIVSFFSGVDNAVLKSVFSQLMSGYTLLAAYTVNTVSVHPRGSVMQENSGKPIFELVKPKARKDTVEKVKKQLLEKIEKYGDPKMKSELSRDSEGNIVIEERAVEDHMLPVMEASGALFETGSVSDLTLSEQVANEANNASSEAFQNRSRIVSAQTMKQVRKELKGKGMSPELAAMIAAGQDLPEGVMRIFYVPGLTRAAAIIGNNFGGNQ